MAKKFFKEYHHYPNETNYKGFDIAYFFTDLLIQEGKDFYKEIDRLPTAATHTTFYFQPTYTQGSFNEETQLLYYENKFVHLFKYENSGLKKLK